MDAAAEHRSYSLAIGLIVGVSVNLPVVRQMPSGICGPLCSLPFKAE
jgi:hypothetical protein